VPRHYCTLSVPQSWRPMVTWPCLTDTPTITEAAEDAQSRESGSRYALNAAHCLENPLRVSFRVRLTQGARASCTLQAASRYAASRTSLERILLLLALAVEKIGASYQSNVLCSPHRWVVAIACTSFLWPIEGRPQTFGWVLERVGQCFQLPVCINHCSSS
jgi:hypothetical protein